MIQPIAPGAQPPNESNSRIVTSVELVLAVGSFSVLGMQAGTATAGIRYVHRTRARSSRCS